MKMALPPSSASLPAAALPILDVRCPSQHVGAHGSASADEEEVKDIYAYGVGLHSINAIVGLSDFTHLQTLSLHGNQIERIEGLEVLRHLVTLNLSSNRITWMEGLSQLTHLRVLNLSNNRIREIAGLQGLVALKTLVLSHNEISLLGGLSALQGPSHALHHLDLRDNFVEYLCELWTLAGCAHLTELVLQCGGYANPVCQASAYRSTLLSLVPRLRSLDGSPCVGEEAVPTDKLLSRGAAAVPSSWAVHHSYPALQHPVVENHHNCVSRNPYNTRSTPEGEPQDHHQVQKASKRGASNCKSPQRVHNNGQGGLRKGHESSDCNRSEFVNQEEDGFFDRDCSKTDHIKHFEQGARGCTHSNYVEDLIVKGGDSNSNFSSVWKESCGEHKRELHESRQDQLQKASKRGASNRKSPQRIHNNGQEKCLQQKIHESDCNCNASEFASQEEEDGCFDHNCSKTDHIKHFKPRFEQGARGASTHYSNAENLIVKGGDSNLSVWKESWSEPKPEFQGEEHVSCSVRPCRSKATDKAEELNGNKEAASGTDNSRYVRFVGKSNKSELVLSQLGATDQKTQTTRELATQTDSASQEVYRLQSNLSTITLVIGGNSSSYMGIEKQNILTNLELYKKDTELLHLVKEKKLIEDEFVAFKKFVGHEKKHDGDVDVDDNHKSMVLRKLLMNLKGCRLELHNLRKIVMQTEKELMTEAQHVESNIIKHVVFSDDAVKLSALSTEILALKEALNSEWNTCQTLGSSLNDANHQKDKAKRMLVSLTTALDEQRSKVKIVTETLENCKHEERKRREECTRLQEELDLVCQVLRKNKDQETKDLVLGAQSAHWHAQGREEAEKVWRPWADEFCQRLVVTQTLVFRLHQENAKALSSVTKLRDMMNEKILELRNVLEAVFEKETGAKELITELFFIVSAQKKKSEWMQIELDSLAASKKVAHEEVGCLQIEVVRMQEKCNAIEEKAMEVEALKWELTNVTTSAAESERQASARVSSLLLENEKLATRASCLTRKIQETQDIIMAKTKFCTSQEAIIEQLKEDLMDANCVSEANIKALEADLVERLQYEVEQKYELRNELSLQESIISKMDEELKVSEAAKYGAEQACKSLQEKVNNVDLMLRHVDEEINGIKTLYEGRERTILNERDDALAKLITMQKKLEDAEASATTAMQAHFESTKLMEAKEQKINTSLIQKDILIEDLKRKVLEVEAKLHSKDLALEAQKATSIAKVEQLGKLLEELREAA